MYFGKSQPLKNNSMNLHIKIPDKDAAFGIKVLKSLSFIEEVNPLSTDAIELWKELSEAAEEVKLHKQGKIKLPTAEELLNEL